MKHLFFAKRSNRGRTKLESVSDPPPYEALSNGAVYSFERPLFDLLANRGANPHI